MRKHLWVFLVYVLLSLVLTWPLASEFTTHVPGDGIDDPSLAWNLWWVKHSLVDWPQNPFAVNWQFWPIGINLAFYTLTILNGLMAVPLVATSSVVVAYNLLLLSSFVLSGFGAYLLSLEFLRMAPGEASKRGPESDSWQPSLAISASAFIGGLLYAFASPKLFYAALGQGNIASSQWIPFAALYVVRLARPGGRARDALLAAIFLVMQAYAELTYASFLLIFVAVAAVWGLLVRRHSRQMPGHPPLEPARKVLASFVFRFSLLAVLFAVGIAPILANMLPDLQAEGDFFTSGGGFADLFSADLAGYAVPTQLHPLFGGIIRHWSSNSQARPDGTLWPVDKGQHIYVGYAALALAVAGAWRERRRAETWFWVASALLFFLMTLGPGLRIGGRDLGGPLPFDLVAQLPFFKGNRYPSRYGVMLLASLAPLISAGAWRGSRFVRSMLLARPGPALDRARIAQVVFPGIALMACLFEHLSVPLPLSDLRVPALYGRVASQPDDFALLELPIGWRNGARVAGKQDIIIMQQLWNQTAHGKRLLGGNTSRNPELKFQYFSEDPTLGRLIAQTNAADLPQHTALRSALAADPVSAEDQARARNWAAFNNIRYVMVHRDKLPPATEADLRSLLPVELVAEEDSLALYRVAARLAIPTGFAVGTAAGRMALAEGWSPPATDPDTVAGSSGPPVYAQRREARLLLPLGTTAVTLRLRLAAAVPEQELTLLVDGRPLDSQPLRQSWEWVTFGIGADPQRPHLSDVRLRFSALADAALAAPQFVPGPWLIGQTGSPSPASILVRSAGQETGDFAHICVNGEELSPNGRGYNLVALHPTSGLLLRAAAFDTHADPSAATRLADWIRGLSPGTIVAGAVRDEASTNLGGEAVDALGALGLTGDLRGRFRWSHAFIGVVGAPPGSAVEEIAPIRPAQVSVGLPVDSSRVAVALSAVEILQQAAAGATND